MKSFLLHADGGTTAAAAAAEEEEAEEPEEPEPGEAATRTTLSRVTAPAASAWFRKSLSLTTRSILAPGGKEIPFATSMQAEEAAAAEELLLAAPAAAETLPLPLPPLPPRASLFLLRSLQEK